MQKILSLAFAEVFYLVIPRIRCFATISPHARNTFLRVRLMNVLLRSSSLLCKLTKTKTPHTWGSCFGDPAENRTPIARMKTWCPNR
jgi:hypothetical protein